MATHGRLDDLETLQTYLKEHRRVNLQQLNGEGIQSVILQRLSEVGVANCSEYVDRLEVDPQEYARLFEVVLPPKSVIQDDRELFDFFESKVIPTLESKVHENVRIWSVGCRTGEEAYSLAITLCEKLGTSTVQERVKIFATDANDQNLSVARQAAYSPERFETISDDLRKKYFNINDDKLTFKNDLRRSVIFGRHDITSDAPISRMDVIVCRGLLPLFNLEQQRKAISRIKFAMKPFGFLLLGKGEQLIDESQLVQLAPRLYSKSALDRREKSADMDYLHATDSVDEFARLQEAALDASRIAQLIVDADGMIVNANRKARSTFGIAIQDFGRPMQDLEISYRPLELRSLIDQVTGFNERLTLPAVPRPLHNGRVQYFDVHIRPLFSESDERIGTCVQFDDVTEYQNLHEELTSLNQQLQTANEELQSTHEELETTNEELQSTNEELETINEELQSSNEELETMNDVLQTTNEELQTSNTQQRELSASIARANNFLESILASIRSGVVVLDERFEILVWNRRCEETWGLRADEVKRKSFFSLDIGLPVARLEEPLHAFIGGSEDYFETVMDAINRTGRAIECKLRATRITVYSRRGLVLLIEEIK
jgi:two-component system, chemotaxis family, CheB/CheR fusion protein